MLAAKRASSRNCEAASTPLAPRWLATKAATATATTKSPTAIATSSSTNVMPRVFICPPIEEEAFNLAVFISLIYQSEQE